MLNSIDHLLGTCIAARFCLFNRDPEDRLLADVPLRCYVSAASPAATEVFCSYSERFGYSETQQTNAAHCRVTRRKPLQAAGCHT